MTTATMRLARAMQALRFESLPEQVIHEAARLVLDFLGVGISGSQTDTGTISGDFAEGQGGPEEATLFGRARRVSALHGAFANAISAHSVELDDVDDLALFHHGPPVVASALAAAEARDSSGAEFLTAVVAGCVTMSALSLATNPALRNRGFHTTPTCGTFGATVASGRLFGLSEAQLVSALGLAGAQASGLMEMYGTSMQKRFNPGPAARNGVTSALLAGLGFTGADSIIEGERAFARAFAGQFDEAAFDQRLEGPATLVIEYKPYSCARPIHNAIDAALDLRQRYGVGPEQLKEIVVYRHSDWAAYHQINHPRTFHEAQVSLPYSVGLAFTEGQALPRQYAMVETPQGAAAMRISELVRIETDDSLQRGVSCRLVVTTNSGEQYEAVVDHPLGSVERPLDDERLSQKFRSLAEPVIGEDRARLVRETTFGLANVEHVSELTRLLAKAS